MKNGTNNFDCKMCGECCCAGYDIYINKKDIENWEKLEKSELLDYIIIKQQSDSGRSFTHTLEAENFKSILKGFDFGLEYIIETDDSGKCPFLIFKLCSIHNFRPIGCKSFPFTKDDCLRNIYH
ncbi:MAG: YkgJ family cysteine cluster protein [Candidatus Heimdallarchaeota archaeon]